jgi:shikimate kinase/3-dehydroquinate synthase
VTPVTSNLVLVGMPGTGKTSVGRLLAERSGRAFMDLDDAIERRTGRSPGRIIREQGEPAFRTLEQRWVRTLSEASGTVVACGGWTVCDAASRSTLAGLGPNVCLTASIGELTDRLGQDVASHRPLLAGGRPDYGHGLETRLRGLEAERREVYDSFPWQVDTTGRSVPEVAEAVQRLTAAVVRLRPVTVPVATPEGGYAVIVARGLLDAAGAVLHARGVTGRVAPVTDDHVEPLYAARLQRSLERAGLAGRVATVASGEASKSLAVVGHLYASFLADDLDRSAAVLALGGGVVGDVAGYAAATYLRGIRLVHLPTSVLAMVDASIGGKTAVDLPQGKNLVGAFHHPLVVLTDPELLATLPPTELRHGLAEVVKTALVGDPECLALLEQHGAPEVGDTDGWLGLVARCARVKAALVSADPWDRGARQRLNLGHTFAHGLEAASGYAMTHGQAVAVGLVAACRLSAELGMAHGDLTPRVAGVLERLGLPVTHAVDPKQACAAMLPDKKRSPTGLCFLLPKAPGEVAPVDGVSLGQVESVLKSLARGRQPLPGAARRPSLSRGSQGRGG